jgi:hypothetical protein
MTRDGHFPAIEKPELLAEDLRAFVRPCGSDLASSLTPGLSLKGALGETRPVRERTATVLQPGWYGSVHSGTGDATAAERSASESHVPTRGGTLRDSYKPTRNEGTKSRDCTWNQRGRVAPS